MQAGGKRKGKRGRGAAGKVLKFWAFEARWQGLYEGYSKMLNVSDLIPHHGAQSRARVYRLFLRAGRV